MSRRVNEQANAQQNGRLSIQAHGQNAKPGIQAHEQVNERASTQPDEQKSRGKGSPFREDLQYSDNQYFKMGAVVAVGELYDLGRLGQKDKVAGDVRCFLESFGLSTIRDVHDLGITGPYLEELEELYA